MSVRTSLLLISLLLLATTVYSETSEPHVCNHHNVNVNHDFLDVPYETTDDGRVLQAYQNIRLYFDFTYASSAAGDFLNYVQNVLLPPAVNYFQSTLQVQPIVGNLTATKLSACIGKNPIPSVYTTTGIAADMVIFVTIVNDSGSSYSASASSCVLSTQNNRPIFGTIAFNVAKLKPTTSTSYIERDTTVVMHELTHALVFSPNLFNYYIDPNTNVVLTNQISTKTINSLKVTILNVAPLTSRLQTYFNCSTLAGAYLENEGTSGSAGTHFERRIFYNEYMTSSTYADFRISEFTLALFEGSGWYKVDYSMAEPMTWGKNKGCSFIDGPCVSTATGATNFDEYCPTIASKQCTWTNRGLGFCGAASVSTSTTLNTAFNYWSNNTVMSDTFSDNCPITTLYSNMDCEDSTNQARSTMPKFESYTYGSKCFMGTLNTPGRVSKAYGYCFQQACGVQADGTRYVNVTVGTNVITCTAPTQITIKGFTGQLYCPDPADFCSQISEEGYCKRKCSGRGSCQNKICVCNDGWGFNDCSQLTYTDNCASCANKDPMRTSCYGDTCACNPANATCSGTTTLSSTGASQLKSAADVEEDNRNADSTTPTPENKPVFYISRGFIAIVAVGSFVILVVGILLGARYAENLKSLIKSNAGEPTEKRKALKKSTSIASPELKLELATNPTKYANVD